MLEIEISTNTWEDNSMKNIMKLTVAFLCIIGMITGLSISSHAEGAASYEATAPTKLTKEPKLDHGKVTIAWQYNAINSTDKVTYQLEVALDEAFTKQYSVIDSETTTAVVSKEAFGENGGYVYMRVRAICTDAQGTPHYSAYSDVSKYTFVKINKTNFPGLYKVLKDWKCYQETTSTVSEYKGKKLVRRYKKTFYLKVSEENKDGWLDPSEINTVHMIQASGYVSKTNETPKYKISSLKGLEYFSKLKAISMWGYTEEKMVVNNPELELLDLITSAPKLILKAPAVKNIEIYGGPTGTTGKLSSVQIDAPNVEDLVIDSPKKITSLKLSPMKNLKMINFNNIFLKNKTLNLNQYKNLKDATITVTGFTTIDAGKCQKLQNVYCWASDHLSKINLKQCKNIKHVGSHSCPKLTSKKVILPKGKQKACKLNKGIWW